MRPVIRRLVLLGALAACGDGITLPDAEVVDAVARELVTVEVRSAHIGSGARVLFLDRDSTLVASIRTDAAGRGNTYVPDTVLSVTIELSGSETGHRWLYTIPNVRPGEHVELDDGTLVMTTSVTVEVEAHNGAVSGYQLETPCGSTSLEADVPTDVQLTNCGSSADMVVLWQNEFLYRADVGIFENAALNLAGEYKPLTSTTVRVVKPRPTTFQVQIQQMLLDGVRPLYTLPGFGFLSFDGFTPWAEASFATPAIPNARILTRLDDFSSNGVGAITVLEWGARSEPTEIELDRGMPRQLLTFPVYEPTTHSVSWLERDQGQRADATLVGISWQDESTLATMHWRMFVERTNNTRITFPRLPGATYQPPHAFVETLTNFAIEGGYERLRKLPILERWNPNDFRWNAWMLDRPEGRLIYESAGPSGGLPPEG